LAELLSTADVNSGNNKASRAFFIGSLPPPSVELLNPLPGTSTVIGNVLVEVSVHPLATNVEVFYNGVLIASGEPSDGVFAFTWNTLLNVPAGQTVTGSLLAVVTDDNGLSGRTTKEVTVNNLAVVDLAVSNIQAPAAAHLGQPTSLSADVENTSSATVSNILVNLFDLTTGSVLSEQTTNLAAGEKKTLTFTTTFASVGEHTLTVTADPLNAIPETNENNNRASAVTTVFPDTDGDGFFDDVDQCQTIVGQYQGCPFGDKNIVDFHQVYLGGGSSTKAPLPGASVRVFDRNNVAFQAVAGSKNPDGSLYGVIYEADAGRISACITGADGVCFAGEAQTGDYLVIVKWIDQATGKTVYVGRPKSPEDFNAEGLATKDFQIIKVFKKGVFQEYRGGSKIVVTGSYLEIIAPESAIWEGTSSIYPFIFNSDADWTVDVCASVPTGYNIVGVYDENGNLISTSQCVQTLVAGIVKIVAFQVAEVGSPEPSADFNLTLKHKGKVEKLSHKIQDIRKATFNAKVNQFKGKSPKGKSAEAVTSSAMLVRSSSPQITTSLWGVVESKLGVNATNDQIKQAVVEVASQNQIAIPEWGIGGRLDSRSLSASILNSLNW